MIDFNNKRIILTLILTIGVNFLYAQPDRKIEIPIDWNYIATPFTEASIRGIDITAEGILWVSGTDNLVAKYDSVSGSWKVFRPGKEINKYDFRDIEIIGENEIIIMAAGENTSSAIFRSENGGESWSKVFDNPDKNGFFDAIDFYDSKNGILVGDPINGRFAVALTNDGGKTWTPLDFENRPATQKGEYQFAASGTQLRGYKGGQTIIVSGGMFARAFLSEDYGVTWKSYPTPALQGIESSGLFSVAKLDNGSFVAVGGDYTQPFYSENNVIVSEEGKSWKVVPHRKFPGYLSAIQHIDEYLIAVGAVNSYISLTNKISFKLFSNDGFHCLAVGDDRIYAAGSDGLVAFITLKQVKNAVQGAKK
ncbi:beta propeller repeat protein [Mangrovivirga cuniculi]|uniref:Photosynthesis system II assembly factor Ycf48/Hcf136-like domain-containing protein n=1 Tax=Mangrovivirga cuniculi TaxID=2715131 RepID=A0A4D7JR86_9BACT|nr:hypothetical protein [Mangrovivirga cuniculi]QCK15262.1 hypothetical protein DCC35_11145 [Mangrovivirga cuniculi]